VLRCDSESAVRLVDVPPVLVAVEVSFSSSASDTASWLPEAVVPELSTNCRPDSVVVTFSCLVCSSCVLAEIPGRVRVKESKSTAKSWMLPVTSRRAWGTSA
jgi:hypothetical protein